MQGTVKMFGGAFGFIRPDDGDSADVFFHQSALREGDNIAVGARVDFEMGVDAKTGRSKSVSVDLV